MSAAYETGDIVAVIGRVIDVVETPKGRMIQVEFDRRGHQVDDWYFTEDLDRDLVAKVPT